MSDVASRCPLISRNGHEKGEPQKSSTSERLRSTENQKLRDLSRLHHASPGHSGNKLPSQNGELLTRCFAPGQFSQTSCFASSFFCSGKVRLSDTLAVLLLLDQIDGDCHNAC